MRESKRVRRDQRERYNLENVVFCSIIVDRITRRAGGETKKLKKRNEYVRWDDFFSTDKYSKIGKFDLKEAFVVWLQGSTGESVVLPVLSSVSKTHMQVYKICFFWSRLNKTKYS